MKPLLIALVAAGAVSTAAAGDWRGPGWYTQNDDLSIANGPFATEDQCMNTIPRDLWEWEGCWYLEKPKYAWRSVGVGDCPANDVRELTPGHFPKKDYCNAQTVGLTAVCWDGHVYKNKDSPNNRCTYKGLSPDKCKGGANPGEMYACVSTVVD